MAYATEKLANLEALGEVTAQLKYYAKKSTVNALQQKVTNLESAQSDYIKGVKVNGDVLTPVTQIVDILIADGTTNGTIKVNNKDVTVFGLAALAYKSSVDTTDLAKAVTDMINAKAEAETVNTISGKVDKLVGTDINKSVRDIALDELTKQLIAENADEKLDDLKEIAAWIQQHPKDAASMNASIKALEDLVKGLPEDADDIADYIDEVVQDAIADLNMDDYATTEAMNQAIETAKSTVTQTINQSIETKLAEYMKTADLTAKIATKAETQTMLSEVLGEDYEAGTGVGA